MSRLRTALIDQYAEHYRRHNASVDPRAIAAPLAPQLQQTYGELIASLSPGSEVLDLGCGTGYLLSWLSTWRDIRPVGVDSSSSQTAIARDALPGIEVWCDEAVPFLRRHPGRFAAIFSLDVLEHIAVAEQLELMEAIRDALVPGGTFVCKVPNAANLTAAQLRYIDLTHVCSFTESSLMQLFTAAEFQHCRVVPVQPTDFGARVRLGLEQALHRAVFRICGDASERVFTRTISMAGQTPAFEEGQGL